LPTRSPSAAVRERLGLAASGMVLWAAAQFVVLTAVAMALYPGGNERFPAAAGYSFVRNFFSDLGGTFSYSGRPNPTGSALFTAALACVGVAIIAFGHALRHLHDTSRQGRLAGRAAAVAATISGAAFIGIGATPWNEDLVAHVLFVFAAFGFLLVFVACMAAVQIRAAWRRRHIAPNVIYVLLLAAYVGTLFAGAREVSDQDLIVQVVAQKAIVYASILNLGWQAFGYLQHRSRASR
jgi:hypothetical membrane protein